MQSLTDQQFLYRSVPVSYDGTGTLVDIKGNTVSFNQLLQNGNFADTSVWRNGSVYISNGKLTLPNRTSSGDQFSYIDYVPFIIGHKYFVVFEAKAVDLVDTSSPAFLLISSCNIRLNVSSTNLTKYSNISICNDTTTRRVLLQNGYSGGAEFYNVQLFDLTLMGIDTYTDQQVKDWFSAYYPLPYYSYTLGSLLPLSATGLKTTGKNLVFDTIQHANIARNGVIVSTPSVNYDIHIAKVIKGETYYVSSDENELVIGYFTDVPSAASTTYNGSRTLTTNHVITAEIDGYIGFRTTYGYQYPMIEFGSSPTTYEAYQSNTLSLPISTYFSNGMKSAGSVYDELDLVNNKAYTRIGRVDLGSCTWTRINDNRADATISNIKYVTSGNDVINAITPQYEVVADSGTSSASSNMVASGVPNQTKISFYHQGYYAGKTDSQVASLFSGQYLYFELASPTETNISTYDLTYPIEDGGTEQIIPVNTSSPTTAPIICDIDYRGMITVTTDDEPNGSGTTTGDGEYRYHSSATVTATSTDLDAYRFSHWEDENGNNVSNNSSYTFTVEE